jgi:hypothetical protein
MKDDYEQIREYKNNELKSRGEVQIARFLKKSGIAYQYEYPQALIDQGKTKIWYPDFRLPQLGMMVEYFGINGDPGYDSRTEHKIETYRREGIEGLFLKEKDLEGDWPAMILSKIEDIQKSRLDRILKCKDRAYY